MSASLDCAAILAADMRQLADDIAAGRAIVGQSVWRSYADRVEAVGTGNIAKLREALVKAEAVLDGIRMMVLQGQEYDIHLLDIDGALGKCRTALAAPPRQCDVGTAEEQRERFTNFCTNNTDPNDIDGWRCDKRCPLYKDHPNCKWEWLHLPYESEVAK